VTLSLNPRLRDRRGNLVAARGKWCNRARLVRVGLPERCSEGIDVPSEHPDVTPRSPPPPHPAHVILFDAQNSHWVWPGTPGPKVNITPTFWDQLPDIGVGAGSKRVGPQRDPVHQGYSGKARILYYCMGVGKKKLFGLSKKYQPKPWKTK